ncbi:MAG: hypothetical protein JXA11_06070 [Phycisphaerae bacterium]|nr:hypothetical protein [Phycisphaerae bacterium]
MMELAVITASQKDVLLAGGILIAVLIAAGFVVLHIRRRWDPRRKKESLSAGMTIEQIEAMRRAGRISDEEFSVMRRRVLKISPAGKESESHFSRSDSIMDDSKEDRPNPPDAPAGRDEI